MSAGSTPTAAGRRAAGLRWFNSLLLVIAVEVLVTSAGPPAAGHGLPGLGVGPVGAGVDAGGGDEDRVGGGAGVCAGGWVRVRAGVCEGDGAGWFTGAAGAVPASAFPPGGELLCVSGRAAGCVRAEM